MLTFEYPASTYAMCKCDLFPVAYTVDNPAKAYGYLCSYSGAVYVLAKALITATFFVTYKSQYARF